MGDMVPWAAGSASEVRLNAAEGVRSDARLAGPEAPALSAYVAACRP